VLQQLIDGTRRLSSSDQDVEIPAEISALFAPEANNLSCVSLQKSSKKDARKSMKVLASHSVDLLCTFADDFLDSSEKRAHLKVHYALSCSLYQMIILYCLFLKYLTQLHTHSLKQHLVLMDRHLRF
jgi:hypothetical protein